MVMMEKLFSEGLSIFIQRPSDALDPRMEDMFQFGPLNQVQKALNAINTIHWPSEPLSCQCAVHVAKSEKSDRIK
jgi:hypothetical protein